MQGIRRQLVGLVSVAFCLTLAACGGGGGGKGGGNSGNNPDYTVSSQTVTYTAGQDESSPPAQTVTITATGASPLGGIWFKLVPDYGLSCPGGRKKFFAFRAFPV